MSEEWSEFKKHPSNKIITPRRITNQHKIKNHTINPAPQNTLIRISLPKALSESITIGTTTHINNKHANIIQGGQKNISTTCDLHNLRSHEAEQVFKHAIHREWSRGNRLLKFITGQNKGVGVIKHQIQPWINYHDIRPLILYATWAKREHGGEGALYILLRKKRNFE